MRCNYCGSSNITQYQEYIADSDSFVDGRPTFINYITECLDCGEREIQTEYMPDGGY